MSRGERGEKKEEEGRRGRRKEEEGGGRKKKEKEGRRGGGKQVAFVESSSEARNSHDTRMQLSIIALARAYTQSVTTLVMNDKMPRQYQR